MVSLKLVVSFFYVPSELIVKLSLTSKVKHNSMNHASLLITMNRNQTLKKTIVNVQQQTVFSYLKVD